MFLSLLKKECKMWLKSIVFYAYVIILFLFYVSQMGEETVLKAPQPGLDDYGTSYSTDKNIIMNGVLSSLIDEYERGYYITYPIGFYKQVILSEEKTTKMEELISELTGKTDKEWKQDETNNVTSDLTYKEFIEITEKVSKLIGAGSNYKESSLKSHGKVDQTYDQAVEAFQDITQKEKVTGSYARLFCDYLGIVLGILPAFFGVTRGIKEKRSRVTGVIYVKPAGSTAIILSRYVGMVIMMFFPVVAVSGLSLTQSVYIANSLGISADYLAYIKYCIGWLLPTILFVSAISYLITEITESIFSIFANAVFWFIAVFKGMDMLLLGAGWNLIPRFNALGEYGLFREILPQLIRNRILYTVGSVIVISILIVVYEIKRRGGVLFSGKISKDTNRKYQA